MTTAVLAAAAGASTSADGLLIWGAVLLAVCIILVFVELLVPSGGLIGLLAGIAAVGSVVAFWRYDTTTGFFVLIAYLVAGPVALYIGFKWWVNSPLGQMMILNASVTDEGRPEVGNEAEDGLAGEVERRERIAQLRELIGAEGRTVTALRPVGVVRIGGERIDALAETGVIASETDVIVTDVYDNQIKVRPRT